MNGPGAAVSAAQHVCALPGGSKQALMQAWGSPQSCAPPLTATYHVHPRPNPPFVWAEYSGRKRPLHSMGLINEDEEGLPLLEEEGDEGSEPSAQRVRTENEGGEWSACVRVSAFHVAGWGFGSLSVALGTAGHPQTGTEAGGAVLASWLPLTDLCC